MKLRLIEIVELLESFAPLHYQEPYDNSGLTVGDGEMQIKGILLCTDITLDVIEEAIQLDANLIISHHPVIFSPLKSITGKTITEKIVLRAIQSNIALYSAHTNLDNVSDGVNQKICEKIGMEHNEVLVSMPNHLKKLVTYVPASHAEIVRNALFSTGAGHVGKYDSCSYNIEGQGSFRPLEGASPYIGKIGELHFEDEIRIETVFPAELKSKMIHALLEVHPYEEVAYDIYPLENTYVRAGAGMIGDLPDEMNEKAFMEHIQSVFQSEVIRHSQLTGKKIKKVAVCGGSGAFLIQNAISSGADVFLTGEIKYHQFFAAEGRILLLDIGHFESEKFTIEIFYAILRKKLTNFAIHFSTINTSPIYYF
jgi:dinuclear metal center YbgI/SA1388 family protein